MKSMKLKASVIVLVLSFLYGCASLPAPDPREILKHPLGTSSLRKGMTKDEILELWGEPDSIEELGADELGVAGELWRYRARYPDAPLNLGYTSKEQKLTFHGDVLVNWQSGE